MALAPRCIAGDRAHRRARCIEHPVDKTQLLSLLEHSIDHLGGVGCRSSPLAQEVGVVRYLREPRGSSRLPWLA